VAILAPRVGRAVSPGLSGVGDGRGHMSVVSVLMVNVLIVTMLVISKLTVDMFMVGMLMVGILTVNMFMVGGLIVGGLMVSGLMVGGLIVRVGGRRRRSGTTVSTGNYVVDGELLKTLVL